MKPTPQLHASQKWEKLGSEIAQRVSLLLINGKGGGLSSGGHFLEQSSFI